MFVKCNIKYSCVDFFNYLKRNPELLQQISSKNKYNTTKSDKDVYIMENTDDDEN